MQLSYAQMLVTALTETCDYNKARAAFRKQRHPNSENLFRDTKKTALQVSTSNERR
jgi:hypothetical protein